VPRAVAGALSLAGNSPRHQAAVNSFVSLSRGIEIYTSIRYVDELPALGVPERAPIDLSVGWTPLDNLRASLTVRNLNDDDHVEFGGGNQIERSAWLHATWTF
jgi:outer membrane receptor protein involved in Fe transport